MNDFFRIRNDQYQNEVDEIREDFVRYEEESGDSDLDYYSIGGVAL